MKSFDDLVTKGQSVRVMKADIVNGREDVAWHDAMDRNPDSHSNNRITNNEKKNIIIIITTKSKEINTLETPLKIEEDFEMKNKTTNYKTKYRRNHTDMDTLEN